MDKAFGDFQTPPALVEQVLSVLQRQGKKWTRLLEPTCGVGNFLMGALKSADFQLQEAYGIELQAQHLEQAKGSSRFLPPTQSVQWIQGSIFDVRLKDELSWNGTGELLILGNPPWVTNAELGRINSQNLPTKYNVKRSKGLSAQTGESNFDLAEAVFHKLILELQDQNPTVAMLCKTTVARNILLFAHQQNLPIRRSFIREVDAKRWFGVAVKACLFYMEIEAGYQTAPTPFFTDLQTLTPSTVVEVRGGKMVADELNYRDYQHLEGRCPLTWRQGVKHDVAAVMELTLDGEGWRNKLGHPVEAEAERIFPLMKGSDLHRGDKASPTRGIIITQYHLSEETDHVIEQFPRLGAYLNQHRALFAQRKSSIYRNRPPFAMFGVGQYTFAPYKVAVAGLYAPPIFRLVMPSQGRAVIFDDTCYFIPCQTIAQARLLTSLLNHPISQAFFASIYFEDAKRPITKGLLQRLNLVAVLEHIGHDELLILAKTHHAESLCEPIADRVWAEALGAMLLEQQTQPLLL
ncbi:MAG: class I SAM-dependent methyltransferase [Phototrophicaceae bacterium]